MTWDGISVSASNARALYTQARAQAFYVQEVQ